MGHRNIETTMDVYNEAIKEKKMESFANLEGKIKISWVLRQILRQTKSEYADLWKVMQNNEADLDKQSQGKAG